MVCGPEIGRGIRDSDLPLDSNALSARAIGHGSQSRGLPCGSARLLGAGPCSAVGRERSGRTTSTGRGPRVGLMGGDGRYDVGF